MAITSLDPVPESEAVWTRWSYISLWLSITIQPSGFILGASLLGMGLSWSEVFVAVLVGNAMVLGPLLLNAMPGVEYRISFPVLCRASFGIRGAQFAALSRGLVAIGWLSFNLWLGAKALYNAGVAVEPRLANSHQLATDLNAAELGAFVFAIVLHMGLLMAGIGRIQKFLSFTAPLQVCGMLALVIWALSAASLSDIRASARSYSNMSNNGTADPSTARENSAQRMLAGIVATCSGWSTLALNIADFSRYAKDRKALVQGQLIGFPPGNVLCPVLGILVVAAAKHVYNKDCWDLVSLFKLWHPALTVIGSLIFFISLLSTNVVYDASWVVTLLLSGAAYWVLMRFCSPPLVQRRPLFRKFSDSDGGSNQLLDPLLSEPAPLN